MNPILGPKPKVTTPSPAPITVKLISETPIIEETTPTQKEKKAPSAKKILQDALSSPSKEWFDKLEDVKSRYMGRKTNGAA